MEEKVLTYPFETVTITSIDHFCKEVFVVCYDTPLGARSVKVCRTDDTMRGIHVGDTVACSKLGEQWSLEYMGVAFKDYRREDNVEVPVMPPLTALIELWCFDRGISADEFCLALSVFFCDHRTIPLAKELLEKWNDGHLELEKKQNAALQHDE